MGMSAKKSRYAARQLQKDASVTINRRQFYEIDAAFPRLINDKPKKHFTQEHYTKLVKKLLPSIKKLIFRMSDNHADQHKELMQHALMAIWEALVIEGHSRNVAFVWVKIKSALSRAWCNDRTMSYGTPSFLTYRKYNTAIKDYVKKHGREPNAEELSKYTKTNINFVRDWLCRRTPRFIPIEKYEAPVVWSSKKNVMDFRQRAQEYEDRLICWIDRHWVRKVFCRLDPISKNGIRCFLSDMSLKQWAAREGIGSKSASERVFKGLWYSRLLAELRFDINEPEDPVAYLRKRGYGVRNFPKRYPRKNEELVYVDKR